MSRVTRKVLEERAKECKLAIAFYNAGNNPQYKVLSADVAYHAASAGQTLFRAKRAGDVANFLEGYYVARRFALRVGFREES